MTESNDDVLICRCEEVSLGEIKEAIARGATTLQEVRRRTRAGMGLCQGRTCGTLVARIIAEHTGKSLEEIMPATARPPVRSIKVKELGGEECCCPKERT